MKKKNYIHFCKSCVSQLACCAYNKNVMKKFLALVLIVEHYSLYRDVLYPHLGKFITIPAMIIIAREITVSALREWMAELGKRANVAVSWIGKWKTTIQLVAIAGLIWRQSEVMIYTGVVLLGVATILTIWSMIMYLKAGAKYMKEEKSE